MPFSWKINISLKKSFQPDNSYYSDNSFQSSFWPVKPVAVRRAFGSLEHDVQAIILEILGHFLQ